MDTIMDNTAAVPTNEQSTIEAQGQSVSPEATSGILNTSVDPFDPAQHVKEPSWLDDLPDELKTSPSLTKFKSKDALAQGYINLQKLLSKKDIPLEELTQHMTPEELATFNKTRGVPDSPEEYQATGLPEFLAHNPIVKGGLEEAKKMAHKYGVSSEMFNEFVQLELDLHQKAVQEKTAANFSYLSNKYGANLDAADQIATKAALKLGGPEAVEALKASGMANNPVIFDMLYKAGTMMKQDSVPVSGASGGNLSTTPADIEGKIKELYNNPEFYAKLKQNDKQAVQMMDNLYQQLDRYSQ